MAMTLEQVRDALDNYSSFGEAVPIPPHAFKVWRDSIDAHLSAQAKVRVTDGDVQVAHDTYWSAPETKGDDRPAMQAALESFAARLSQGAQGEAIYQVRNAQGSADWTDVTPSQYDNLCGANGMEWRILYTHPAERAAVPERVVARGVFDELVSVMGSDNGVFFRAEPGDYERALGGVAAMISAGYFQCEVDDLDSDYWQMAAGEESEIAERFGRAPEAFATVSTVMNDIFDRPLPDVKRAAVPDRLPEAQKVERLKAVADGLRRIQEFESARYLDEYAGMLTAAPQPPEGARVVDQEGS